jgi:ribonucleotide reductase alpha subunit
MQVIKRNGLQESMSFDKITKRISDLCFGLKYVDPLLVAKDTINDIFDKIKTSELDVISADICAVKSQHHPDYNLLGGRILASNITKTTSENYIEVVTQLYTAGIISKEFYAFVSCNNTEIQEIFDYQRDYILDFFAIKTLERSYLFKINGKIVERPQHMWMRVAIQIHGLKNVVPLDVMSTIKETYDLMSTLYFTHATPTLFNSGTNNPQLSSCFLTSSEDNIEDIFKSISNIAKISKWAGGIGLSLSNIRAKGSTIRGTNGKSEGIIPLCKTLETVGRYINQGGKRNGSIATYLEPWHADIFAFIELRKNTGDENLRARDLFIALWIPDLFMKRVQDNDDWTLMCPDECKGLVDNYGEEFESLYIEYEQKKMGKKVIKARELWNHILENQIETGMPYISYKDTVNKKNMQKHLGTIRNSNLCVAPETMLLTSDGYFEIKYLENNSVKVWNGEEFSETIVYKTGQNQELCKIILSDGNELECTLEHTFYDSEKNPIKACQLQRNTKLLAFSFPVIKESLKTPFAVNNQSNFFIPINYSLTTKIIWLSQYIEANKCNVNELCFELFIHDINFVEKFNYFLQTLGCHPKMVRELKLLIISNKDLNNLFNLGLTTTKIPNRLLEFTSSLRSVFVKDVIFTKRFSDTYCFTEKKRGMGVFNGILTGQCNEIALYSNKDNIAVCNLASICLPRFVKEDNSFDFQKLQYVSEVITRNLNNVIDVNFYPTEECSKTNFENRPIGIGVQGLADVYCLLGLSFGSDEARNLNKLIFENIYYGCVKSSIELSKKFGPYKSYQNSPHSNGFLQFNITSNSPSLSLDWSVLFDDMKKYGIRNSLLTALMPTASTSQIMCNNECFEPYTSNIYIRKTLAGEFTVVNQHLIKDLIKLGLWNTKIYEEILYDNGSVQKVKDIPMHIKEIYKTAFELKMTDILKQAVERSPFIDHMQSMNLFMAKPDFSLLNSSHFYSWKNDLKTGMYYLRTQPAVDAVKFGLDPTSILRIKDDRKNILKDAGVVEGTCSRDPYLRTICEACSA